MAERQYRGDWDEDDPEWRNSVDDYIESNPDQYCYPAKRRKLTWYQKRQALADAGIDTLEEYRDYMGRDD